MRRMRGSHSIAPKATTKSIFILIPPERKPKTMNQEQSPIANREVSGDRERQRKNAHDNLVHAGEFTKIENTAIVYVLRGWFAGLSGVPGALEAGDDAWANTTLFEHFVSKLNADA